MNLRCIFNADDFALNEACSHAIINAVEHGRLQATSVLAGGEDHRNYNRLKNAGNILINAHLNLLEGKALTPGGEEFGITTQDGYFHLTLGQLIIKLSMASNHGRLKKWVFEEFCKQIEFVYDHFPNHEIRLDGHLHIHILPALRNVVDKVIQKYTVKYVRIPAELRYVQRVGIISEFKGNLRRSLLAYWGRGLKKLLEKRKIKTSDFFLGAQASCKFTLNDLNQGLKTIAHRAKQDDVVIEIMTHPVSNEPNNSSFYKDSSYSAAHLTIQRCNELKMLLSDDICSVLDKNNAMFSNSL